MASVIDDPNGRKRILFVASDGSRKAIRLGKATAKQADAFKVRVEQLILVATGATSAIDDETARWVAALDDRIHGRLAKVGLVQSRERANATLGKFLADFRANLHVKPATLIAYGQACDNLLEYFGETRAMRAIEPADADQWRKHLQKSGLSEATVSRRVGVAKHLFRLAVRWKLIPQSPFADVKAGGQVNIARMFFITRDMAGKVLDACPDAQWRLLFALSRYGGLRCPSEHLGLRWGDVDWERGRFLVHSPKTEHHAGGGTRWVPIFPELLPYLREVYEAAEPGTEYAITRYRDHNCNLRTHFERIIKRAGLEPWPKLFANLRSSRETELCQNFPVHVVCKWIGNTPRIAQQHYLQVTDEHFAAAIGDGDDAAQKAAQQTAAKPCVASRQAEEPAICGELRGDATPNENLMGRAGIEPATQGFSILCSTS
jgi:integrase